VEAIIVAYIHAGADRGEADHRGYADLSLIGALASVNNALFMM
jgi:hypothetical protein